VRGMDALDGSILLDIKPYSAGIDSFPQARIAWQKDGDHKEDTTRVKHKTGTEAW